MKSVYNRTTWIDGKTPVNAANLNNIENAIGKIFTNALTVSEFSEGSGIDISVNSDGEVVFGVDETIPRSTTINSFEVITEEPEEWEEDNVMYYVVLEGKLKKIVFNKVAIYEVE